MLRAYVYPLFLSSFDPLSFLFLSLISEKENEIDVPTNAYSSPSLTPSPRFGIFVLIPSSLSHSVLLCEPLWIHLIRVLVSNGEVKRKNHYQGEREWEREKLNPRTSLTITPSNLSLTLFLRTKREEKGRKFTQARDWKQ